MIDVGGMPDRRIERAATWERVRPLAPAQASAAESAFCPGVRAMLKIEDRKSREILFSAAEQGRILQI